jgi:hypothetical protein
MLKELEEDLKRFCKEHHLSLEKAQEIIHTLQILTRHKRDFYYRSISAIFSCPYQNIKESAIKIKLADRTHNIQCLDSFTGKQKIYQCFKNLFILNNTKQFLLQKFGPTLDPNRSATGIEKLFKKCAKATYDAFLTVCRTNLSKGITPVESMLELAFKKYAWERAGWWTVTSIAENETHLMRLYQGIIRKYDARLHQEWKRLDELEKMEKEYCRKFFQDYQFSSEQIEAILEYKDAYALKEVIARLLYKPNFVISGFACSHLCSRYKSCIKRRKGGAFPR